jgi:pimeloyl-ACP methyl ester carboxylesterase
VLDLYFDKSTDSVLYLARERAHGRGGTHEEMVMNEETRELATVHDSVLSGWGVGHRFLEAVAGERVHVLEHGDGPPLVILHGTGPTSLQLLPLVSRISRSRAIAVDRPGFGLSDPHDWSGPRRKASVEWLHLVLDALGLESVNLLGSSAGGTWAIWYALANPDRVRRLVLVGAPPALSATTPPEPMRMVASIDPANPPQMPPPSRETVVASMAAMGEAETIVAYPDLLDAMVAAGRDATSGRARFDELKSLIAADGWQPDVQTDLGELRSIATPTLLIWGRADPLGDTHVANLVADAIPDSRLELLDAGHGPWLGHPDAVANLTDVFVTGD